MEALNGTVMQLMPSKSAINFPASSTFPPPAAIIPSQLLFFEIKHAFLISNSQQSCSNSKENDWIPCKRRSFLNEVLIALVELLLPINKGL